jgi:hypothetical protein
MGDRATRLAAPAAYSPVSGEAAGHDWAKRLSEGRENQQRKRRASVSRRREPLALLKEQMDEISGRARGEGGGTALPSSPSSPEPVVISLEVPLEAPLMVEENLIPVISLEVEEEVKVEEGGKGKGGEAEGVGEGEGGAKEKVEEAPKVERKSEAELRKAIEEEEKMVKNAPKKKV